MAKARKISKTTLDRLTRKLADERARLEAVLADFEEARETMRLAETASEHNADPENSDGGSLAFEIEKELSLEQNARDLLSKVLLAQQKMEKGTYGVCEVSGEPIPVARLDALPYARTRVEWADRI